MKRHRSSLQSHKGSSETRWYDGVGPSGVKLQSHKGSSETRTACFCAVESGVLQSHKGSSETLVLQSGRRPEAFDRASIPQGFV